MPLSHTGLKGSDDFTSIKGRPSKGSLGRILKGADGFVTLKVIDRFKSLKGSGGSGGCTGQTATATAATAADPLPASGREPWSLGHFRYCCSAVLRSRRSSASGRIQCVAGEFFFLSWRE